MSKLSRTELSDLDQWIEQLKNCQPLEECQVKILCEKVNNKNIMLNINLYNNIHKIIIGKRNIKRRTKCSTSKSTSNSMWRYTWTIF